MSTENGLLFVISGPSGVGKGTIVQRVLEIEEDVVLSVSATTRSKRETEVNGRDYYFCSKAEFLNMVKRDKLLEFAEYCGNYYGTPKNPIKQWNEEGVDVLLEIEVKGARQVKQRKKECVCIFIVPPSEDVLAERLKKRGTESSDSFYARLERAKDELKEARFYDYLVVNDEVDLCARKICCIIRAEKMRLCNSENLLRRFSV